MSCGIRHGNKHQSVHNVTLSHETLVYIKYSSYRWGILDADASFPAQRTVSLRFSVRICVWKQCPSCSLMNCTEWYSAGCDASRVCSAFLCSRWGLVSGQKRLKCSGRLAGVSQPLRPTLETQPQARPSVRNPSRYPVLIPTVHENRSHTDVSSPVTDPWQVIIINH